MIPLSVGQTIGIIFCFWFLVVAFLWYLDERRRSYHNWTIAKEHLYTCPRCHLSFLASDDAENIMRCPRCNEMCFLKRKRKL